MISPATDTENMPGALRQSILRCGLLHPPILRLGPKGRYQIISGRKRLQITVTDLQWKNIPCLVLDEANNNLEALAIAMEETLASRPLTPAEQAIFLKKISKHQDNNESAISYLPLFDRKPDSRTLSRLIKLADQEKPILEALHRGEIQESTAHELSKLPFADRFSLLDLILLLGLSLNNQKKLMATCQELASRKKSTIVKILAAQEVKDILEHPNTNAPQKSAKLMALLAERLSPRLTRAEKEFRCFANGLKLPKFMRLSHSQSFERDEMSLTIDFKNREKLQQIWPVLAAMFNDKPKA